MTSDATKKTPNYQSASSLGTDILVPSVLAHEMRTPIGAVQGFASLIAQEAYGPVGDERYIDAARQMIQACQHMESVVANVLDVAKKHSVDDQLEETDVDLSELLETTQSWLQDKIVAAKVIVRSRIPLVSVCVRGDQRRLRQAVLNILENAVRYTPAKGYIDIEIVTDDEEWVEIAVTNDLSDPQKTSSRIDAIGAIGGFGLGLYVTRCQMKVHGGDVNIFPMQDGRVKASLMLPVSRRMDE